MNDELPLPRARVFGAAVDVVLMLASMDRVRQTVCRCLTVWWSVRAAAEVYSGSADLARRRERERAAPAGEPEAASASA